MTMPEDDSTTQVADPQRLAAVRTLRVARAPVEAVERRAGMESASARVAAGGGGVHMSVRKREPVASMAEHLFGDDGSQSYEALTGEEIFRGAVDPALEAALFQGGSDDDAIEFETWVTDEVPDAIYVGPVDPARGPDALVALQDEAEQVGRQGFRAIREPVSPRSFGERPVAHAAMPEPATAPSPAFAPAFAAPHVPSTPAHGTHSPWYVESGPHAAVPPSPFGQTPAPSALPPSSFGSAQTPSALPPSAFGSQAALPPSSFGDAATQGEPHALPAAADVGVFQFGAREIVASGDFMAVSAVTAASPPSPSMHTAPLHGNPPSGPQPRRVDPRTATLVDDLLASAVVSAPRAEVPEPRGVQQHVRRVKMYSRPNHVVAERRAATPQGGIDALLAKYLNP